MEMPHERYCPREDALAQLFREQIAVDPVFFGNERFNELGRRQLLIVTEDLGEVVRTPTPEKAPEPRLLIEANPRSLEHRIYRGDLKWFIIENETIQVEDNHAGIPQDALDRIVLKVSARSHRLFGVSSAAARLRVDQCRPGSAQCRSRIDPRPPGIQLGLSAQGVCSSRMWSDK